MKKVQDLRGQYSAATQRADKPSAMAALQQLLVLLKQQVNMEGWLATAVGPVQTEGPPGAVVSRLWVVFGPTPEVDVGIEKVMAPDLTLTRVQLWLYDYAPKENETGNCKGAMASVLNGDVVRFSGRLMLPEYRAAVQARYWHPERWAGHRRGNRPRGRGHRTGRSSGSRDHRFGNHWTQYCGPIADEGKGRGSVSGDPSASNRAVPNCWRGGCSFSEKLEYVVEPLL